MSLPRRALRFVVRHSLVVACVASCILVGVAFIAPPLVVAGVGVGELLLMGLLVSSARKRWQERARAWESHAGLLAEAATVDEVTGLGNYREFEFEWWHHLARFKRRLEPFAVAVIEVADAADGSRTLSNTALRRVSGLLLQTARSEDTVFRVDEQVFAVLLADSRREGGEGFVDRARSAISSRPLDDDGKAVHVTTRGGVAEWQPEMQSMAAMLEAAEEDLRRFGDEKRRQEAYFAPDPGHPADGDHRKVS